MGVTNKVNLTLFNFYPLTLTAFITKKLTAIKIPQIYEDLKPAIICYLMTTKQSAENSNNNIG